MSKKQIITPVVATKQNNAQDPLGVLVDALEQLSEIDGAFDMNEPIEITCMTENGENFSMRITKNVHDENEFFNVEEANKIAEPIDDDGITEEYEDITMQNYLFGINDKTFIEGVRMAPAETLMQASVLIPNREQLCYERNHLHPYQNVMLDEIRNQNIFVAEQMAEIYRRQMSALLEYQTQCMAMFAESTNKTMCVIVDDTIGDL